MFLILVGTSRCDVPARVGEGGKNGPRHTFRNASAGEKDSWSKMPTTFQVIVWFISSQYLRMMRTPSVNSFEYAVLSRYEVTPNW
jgi:hypothetical protein